MKTLPIIFVAALVHGVVACSSGKSPYEAVAASANPTLLKLRALAAPLFSKDATAPSSAAGVAAACVGAEPELTNLRDLDFHDRQAARKAGTGEVQTIVRTLLDHRPTMCPPDSGDGTNTAMCQAWCVERWKSLSAAIDLAAVEARREGVNLASLSAQN